MQSKRKILAVEDNRINRTVLKGILEADYDVLEAENGLEALALLDEYGEGISLILLDLIMPVMDGFAFLGALQDREELSSIPVIVATQSEGEPDEIRALSCGAMDFIVKPYRPQVILHRVANMIKMRETAAITNLVKYDRVTGLYGREYFQQQAGELLRRRPDKDYDIICSDIENFKLINDVFGVPAGNALLRGVGELYTRVIGERGICSRLTSDQFAALVERGDDYTDELFHGLNDAIAMLPNAANVSVNWGVYRIEERVLSVEQMCDRALLAARSIRGQYGRFCAIYDDELRSRLLREQAITAAMENAIDTRQFVVYFQPKYCLNGDHLCGAEALVRWQHPEWGLQRPDEFIPLFEKSGFITRLDHYVWEETCRILADWDKLGFPPVPVSVNVSRADIYRADIEEIFLEMISRHNITADRLHLEITESAYTEDPRQLIETVASLREHGFVVEMDDFGSGYSSLNMLTDLPIDILKLDMKFVRSETARPSNESMLKFIISLARWMELKVVAEGVETLGQLERLRDIGCDYAQGYYFSPPIPRERFEQLLLKDAKMPEGAE